MYLSKFARALNSLTREAREKNIDPLSQPTVTASRDHCFRTSVRPSPLFKSSKTKQQKTMSATGVTMGLAEWLIDDTCLVLFKFFFKRY